MKVRVGRVNRKLIKRTKTGGWRTKDAKSGTHCKNKHQV